MKDFTVGHTSSNQSSQAQLTWWFFLKMSLQKEVATCWYEHSVNPIKRCARMS
jgi:hypothetical protein